MTALDRAARKVRPHHLEREACLYVRQSSPRQVRDNPESRACQYALQQRAVELGWPASRVRVIDDDLGQSGGDSQRRDGFKDLLARVSLGEVGIVMGLEVSRLARNNADWHRLLQLCALSDTLVLDGDGVYDPHDINDRLVLGLKGTMSEVELHTMRARLLGGARNKARRGELELALPTGLALREDGAVTLDPDASVVSAIGAVFATFRKAGSAHGTAKRLREDGVQLPRRPRSGPSKGEVTWVAPTGPRVNAILRNPRYAGAYVYGRTRSIPARGTADPPEPASRPVAGAAAGGAPLLHRLAGVSAQPRDAGPQPGRGRLRRRPRVAAARGVRPAAVARPLRALRAGAARGLRQCRSPRLQGLLHLQAGVSGNRPRHLPVDAGRAGRPRGRPPDRRDGQPRACRLGAGPAGRDRGRGGSRRGRPREATRGPALRSRARAAPLLRSRPGTPLGGRAAGGGMERPPERAGKRDPRARALAAARQHRQGLSNWNGAPFHARRVRDIRRYYRLPSLAQRLADRGFVTARAMAARLGVCVSTVRTRTSRRGIPSCLTLRVIAQAKLVCPAPHPTPFVNQPSLPNIEKPWSASSDRPAATHPLLYSSQFVLRVPQR